MLRTGRYSISSRIVRGSSVVVPTLIGLFCVIATVLPYGAVGGFTFTPIFPLAAIFFFVLTRPSQMTPVSVFAIGILQDLLTGGPVGLWALVYLLCYAATSAMRVLFVGRSAMAAWPGFLIVSLLAGLCIWVIASLLFGTPINVVPVVGQMMLTASLYPPLAWVFTRFLPQEEN